MAEEKTAAEIRKKAFDEYVAATKAAMADIVHEVVSEMKIAGIEIDETDAVDLVKTDKAAHEIVAKLVDEVTGIVTTIGPPGAIMPSSLSDTKKEPAKKKKGKIDKKVVSFFKAKKPHKDDVKAALALLLHRRVKVTDSLHVHSNMRKGSVDMPLDLNESIPARKAMRYMAYARFAEIKTNEINLTRINKKLTPGLFINKETAERMMNMYNMARLTTLSLPGLTAIPLSAYDDTEYLREIRSGSPLDVALALSMRFHIKMLKQLEKYNREEVRHPFEKHIDYARSFAMDAPKPKFDDEFQKIAAHGGDVDRGEILDTVSLIFSKICEEVVNPDIVTACEHLETMAKDYVPRGKTPKHKEFLTKVIPAALRKAQAHITKTEHPTHFFAYDELSTRDGTNPGIMDLTRFHANIAAIIREHIIGESKRQGYGDEADDSVFAKLFCTDEESKYIEMQERGLVSWGGRKHSLMDKWLERITRGLAAKFIYGSPTFLPTVIAYTMFCVIVKACSLSAWKEQYGKRQDFKERYSDFYEFALSLAATYQHFFYRESPPGVGEGKEAGDMGMTMPKEGKAKESLREKKLRQYEDAMDPDDAEKKEEEGNELPDQEDLDIQFEDVDQFSDPDTSTGSIEDDDYDAMAAALAKMYDEAEEGSDTQTLIASQRNTASQKSKMVRRAQKWDKDKRRSGINDLGPGKCSIIEGEMCQALPGHMIGRRWKSSPIGNIVRSTHRWATDRWIFTERMKGKGVSLLLDGSGSMGIGPTDITRLLQLAPASIFAVYGGGMDAGQVLILARNGMSVDLTDASQLRPHRDGMFWGGNIVDVGALKWLNMQPKPRIWVSDGWVTGINDGQYPSVERACAYELQVGGIQCAHDIDAAIDLTRSITMGTPDYDSLEELVKKGEG